MIMGIRQRLSNLLPSLFQSGESKRIGIYGPPNAGKSTLANQILRDWDGEGEVLSSESEVQHETREAHEKKDVTITGENGGEVTIDIIDTPGVATKVDYQEFTDDMEKEDAQRRSREATEGVAEAMHWLKEDIDGVIYVMDASEDPFTQVNTMLIGIIEEKDIPAIVVANKTDLRDSSVSRIRGAFPQHTTVPASALQDENMDEVYDNIAEMFG